MSKIAITGIGCVTSYSTNVQEFWKCMRTKEKRKDVVFPEELKVQQYYNVPLGGHYCLEAAKQAIASANLDIESKRHQVGIMTATTFGSIEVDLRIREILYEKNFKKVSPLQVIASGKDFYGNYCSNNLKIKGFCHTLAGNVLAGIQGIELACQSLQRKRMDAVLVGGVDVVVDTQYEHARDMENGAVYLVLERLEDVIARKQKVLAVIEEVKYSHYKDLESVVKDYIVKSERYSEHTSICFGQGIEQDDSLDGKKYYFDEYYKRCFAISTFYQILMMMQLFEDSEDNKDAIIVAKERQTNFAFMHLLKEDR